jgi:hypothetical protein
MSRIKRLSISGTITITLLILFACSPVVNHPGKQIFDPKIEKEHFVAADGSMLPVRVWLPKNSPVKAVIVGLHGFNDYSNFFASPGNYLSHHGIA